MNGKSFLDSNVVIYAYSDDEPDKQAIARRLVKTPGTFASTQVLQEFCNATRRRLKSDWPAIRIAVTELQSKLHIHTNTASTLRDALRIAERYGFSFYDSLILAAALETGCTTLYSEDMQHGQVIDGKLEIQNPFL